MEWSLFLLLLMGQCSFSTCQLYEYHFIRDNKTWSEARDYCREHYTDLVTVNNMTDLDRLCDKDPCEEGWIGIYSEKNKDGTWFWSNGTNHCEHWNDIPQGAEKTQCVVMGGDKRCKSDKCEKQRPFYCYDDNMVLVRQDLTWSDALNYCRTRNYDLVSITNATQQTLVQKRAQKAGSAHVWVGLRYTCSLDLWFWVSNRQVCYQNWDQVNSEGQVSGCNVAGAVIKGETSKWVRKQDTETFNFICSK